MIYGVLGIFSLAAGVYFYMIRYTAESYLLAVIGLSLLAMAYFEES